MTSIKKTILWSTVIAGNLILIGCGDPNDYTSKPLPPPTDAKTATSDPQAAAAEAKKDRKGKHYQNAQAEGAGAAEPGDGR